MKTSLFFNPHTYALLRTGINVEKNMCEAYNLIGDTRRARESFHKVLDGELTLSIIRLYFLRNKQLDQTPDFF